MRKIFYQKKSLLLLFVSIIFFALMPFLGIKADSSSGSFVFKVLWCGRGDNGLFFNDCIQDENLFCPLNSTDNKTVQCLSKDNYDPKNFNASIQAQGSRSIIETNALKFVPQVSIPGSLFTAKKEVGVKSSLTTIGEYFVSLYDYLLAIVGLLAAIVLMISGVIWLTAAGNSEKISQAKSWLFGSLTGLVLVLASFTLLKIVNPNLVSFRDKNVPKISIISVGSTGKSSTGTSSTSTGTGDSTGTSSASTGTGSTSTPPPLELFATENVPLGKCGWDPDKSVFVSTCDGKYTTCPIKITEKKIVSCTNAAQPGIGTGTNPSGNTFATEETSIPATYKAKSNAKPIDTGQPSAGKAITDLSFKAQVTIPGSLFRAGESIPIGDSLSILGHYLVSFYDYLLAIIGLLAAIVLMISGVIWLTAAGNSEKVSQAKSWLFGSLTGLILALVSFTLLKTISPSLVEFRETLVPSIEGQSIGCCKASDKRYTNAHGAESCYNEIIKANPNTLLVEKDKSKLDKDLGKKGQTLENYLINKGVFSPSERANQLKTGCEKEDFCLCLGQNCNPSFLFPSYCWGINCFPYSECLKTGAQNPLWLEECCEALSNKDAEEIKKIKETSKKNTATIENICAGRSNGKKCKGYSHCYCYEEMPFMGDYGRVGEPCGNDGGVCVKKTGSSSCKAMGYEGGREHGIDITNPLNRTKSLAQTGGRACGSGSKCCIP